MPSFCASGAVVAVRGVRERVDEGDIKYADIGCSAWRPNGRVPRLGDEHESPAQTSLDEAFVSPPRFVERLRLGDSQGEAARVHKGGQFPEARTVTEGLVDGGQRGIWSQRSMTGGPPCGLFLPPCTL